MLKKYKNEIFEILRSSKFGINKFDWQEISEIDFIKFKETPFYFAIRPFENHFDYFHCDYVEFNIGLTPTGWQPHEYDESITFSGIKKKLTNWLEDDLQGYWDELEQIDLWKEYKNSNESLRIDNVDFTEKSRFTTEEQTQIKLSIDELKLLILDKFDLNAIQQQIVYSRLDYLSESTNRLNKFDWKSVAISTAISIAVALSLDTTKGQILYDLFTQAFSVIPKLISG